MTDKIQRDTLSDSNLLGQIIMAAMLNRADQVEGSDGVLYRVPGWENIQDVPELFVKTEINGVEVSLSAGIQQIDSELEETSEERINNACYLRAAKFFKTLASLESDVVSRLRDLLSEGEKVSAPRQNEDMISKDEIIQLLTNMIPPLVAAAKKWGDVRMVDTLEQLAQRLQAMMGGSA